MLRALYHRAFGATHWLAAESMRLLALSEMVHSDDAFEDDDSPALIFDPNLVASLLLPHANQLLSLAIRIETLRSATARPACGR